MRLESRLDGFFQVCGSELSQFCLLHLPVRAKHDGEGQPFGAVAQICSDIHDFQFRDQQRIGNRNLFLESSDFLG